MATYQQLFNLCKKKFNISWLYGQSHANEKLFLTEKAKQYPTLCVGFLNIIHPDRLHIIGPAEIEFFNQISHDAPENLTILSEFFQSTMHRVTRIFYRCGL